MDACSSANINLATAMNNSIVSHKNALTPIGHDYDNYEAFTGVPTLVDVMDGFVWEDQHYFLQLYIPFVEDVDLTEIPVICFGHQEVESTIGFKLNAQNQVQVIAVDEAYAKQHLVWIVSINEVVEAERRAGRYSSNKEWGCP